MTATNNTGLTEISIPEEYKDFNIIIKDRKTSQFVSYLADSCPISGTFPKLFVNKSTTSDNVKKTLDKIFNYSKGFPILNTIPVYTLSYICALLACVRNETETLENVLTFLHDFIKADMNPEYLDILFPTIFFNTANDDPSLRIPFVLFLAETYDPNVVVEYLLHFYNSLKNNHFIVTRLHLVTLTRILENFSVDDKILERCKEFANFVYENEQSTTQLQNLLTTIDQCDINDPSYSPKKSGHYEKSFHSYRKPSLNINTTPDLKKRRQSLISPSSPIGEDLLDGFLDRIENNMYSNAIEILNLIRSQLDRLHSFPADRSIEPLFDLAFRTQANKSTTPEERQQIFLLMSPINTYCDPYQLLRLYISYSQDPHKVSNRDFLEQCYQHFISISRNSGKLKNVEIPNSLSVNDSETPEEKVEFAFTCLNKWDTSYDGVNRIWEIIKSQLSVNSDIGSDMYDHFDQLQFTQQTFLVAGIRSHMEEAAGNGDANEFDVTKMEVVIDNLEQQISTESKRDRLNREISAVTERCEQIIIDKDVKPQTEGVQKHDVSLSNLSKLSSTANTSSTASQNARSDDASMTGSTSSYNTPNSLKKRNVDDMTSRSILRTTDTASIRSPVGSLQSTRRTTAGSKLRK